MEGVKRRKGSYVAFTNYNFLKIEMIHLLFCVPKQSQNENVFKSNPEKKISETQKEITSDFFERTESTKQSLFQLLPVRWSNQLYSFLECNITEHNEIILKQH